MRANNYGLAGKPIQERLMALVTVSPKGCWEYGGAANRAGYTMIRNGRGKRTCAHRIAYELFVGPIPQGLEIDHICHVRRCVNPAHLRAVTAKQNRENFAGARSDSRTGVRGVQLLPNGTYRTSVTHHGQRYEKAGFTSLSDATEYVTALRNRLFTHNDADKAVA